MIEFNGYLTGKSFLFLQKKDQSLGRKAVCFGFLGCAPIIYSFGILLRDPKSIYFAFYLIALPICLMLTFIPKSKKQVKKMTPYRIFVEGDIITSVTEMNVETKFIEDVKTVRDYGEFYELIFPFGKISHNFICQKSLLSKGSLEDFEKLFEGKLTRR